MRASRSTSASTPTPPAAPTATPGPWAAMPESGAAWSIWTALPGGELRRIADVHPSLSAAADAALLAASARLAFELRATLELLERVAGDTHLCDAIIAAQGDHAIEIDLLRRLGALRRAVAVTGLPAPAEGDTERYACRDDEVEAYLADYAARLAHAEEESEELVSH